MATINWSPKMKKIHILMAILALNSQLAYSAESVTHVLVTEENGVPSFSQAPSKAVKQTGTQAKSKIIDIKTDASTVSLSNTDEPSVVELSTDKSSAATPNVTDTGDLATGSSSAGSSSVEAASSAEAASATEAASAIEAASSTGSSSTGSSSTGSSSTGSSSTGSSSTGSGSTGSSSTGAGSTVSSSTGSSSTGAGSTGAGSTGSSSTGSSSTGSSSTGSSSTGSSSTEAASSTGSGLTVSSPTVSSPTVSSAEGWTIIEPQSNSRFIYVSNSDGNDEEAHPYTVSEISEPRNPPNTIYAFKSISKALTYQRAGFSDWVLLKKGDQWQLENTISLPSGKSSVAPLILTSYGSSTQRPVIKTGVKSGIELTQSRSYIAIIGLEFYANQRDPDSVDFLGWNMVDKPGGFVSVTSNTENVESILLEDNVFKFFANNVQFNGNSKHNNIIVRRNQFLNSYSTTGHSQGLFAASASILIEENLFDHNGWYQQNYEQLNSKVQGQATYFNHNVYMGNMFDKKIKGNIFTRASCIGLKLTANPYNSQKKNVIMSENIVIDNNLFIEGEVGISAGGNTDFNNGYRWKNMSIINNVMLNIGNSQPTRRELSWQIEVNDWDTGIVNKNYMLCNINASVTNVSGINLEGMNNNIDIADNVLYGLKFTDGKTIYESNQETKVAITANGNYVESNDLQSGKCHDPLVIFVKDKNVGLNEFIDEVKKQSRDNWDNAYTAPVINSTIRSLF